LTVFSVSAVITASTPGTFSASLSSIFLTRAWACGERTKSPCSMPGSFTSST
jgi:hypothetical protein